MRILHVLDHSIPLHSGYTFRTRAILEQQRRMGYETFHLTSPKHLGEYKPEEKVDGFKFYRTAPLPYWAEKLPLLNQWTVARQLEKRLDELIPQLRPDVLHAHSPALNGIAALNMGRKHRIPVVYECRAFWEDAAVDHGTTSEGSLRYRLTKTLETHVFHQADAITTICEGLKQDIVQRRIPTGKVTVVPNAVDLERFAMGLEPDPNLQEQLGLDGKTVLGFIGSFYAYEGLSLLLEALPRILATQPDVRVLLVGGGPQEAILHHRAETLGLEGNVTFTGRVPHDQVQKYYDLVDIFIYPRLTMRLTELVTPLKPLEAMAQGKLVLASDVGGHRELIRDGETGLLFAANDSQALADSVLQVVSEQNLWPEMIERARRFVEEERNWETSVNRYRNVYAAVTDVENG